MIDVHVWEVVKIICMSTLVCLQALKILKTPEFMPYVVFIASPPIDTLREIHKRATSEGTITKKQTVSSLGTKL